MKILLINQNFLGDVLLTTPAIKALRKVYKDALIVSLVGEDAKEILLNNPYLNKIIFKKKGLKNFWALLKTIKKYNFDLAILFHDTLGNAFLSWLANIPQRIGYKKEGAQFFLTTTIKKIAREHTIISHLKLVNNIGVDPEKCSKKMEIFWKEQDENNTKGLLIKEKISLKYLIVTLCPFTTREAKQWPLEWFAQIGDFLIQKYNAQVTIVGISNELPLAEKILNLMKEKGINLVGKTTIKELAYFLKKCQLVITVDSASMHLAAAIEKPVILSLFGSTEPNELAPYEKKHFTLYKKIDCSPCKKNKCRYKTYQCMKEITPSLVMQTIDKLAENWNVKI